MYKYILEAGGDINWMALYALITFVTVFTISVVVVLGKSKKEIEHMANLPLEDDSYSGHPQNSSI